MSIPVPLCNKCQSPMRVRTNSKGTAFLGCSSWPKTKCNFTLSLLGEGSQGGGVGRAFAVLSEAEFQANLPQPTYRGKITKATGTLIGWLHKVRRRRLESDEPDATGTWEPRHRRAVLRYVYDRDGGRCGLCSAKTKIEGAQVEHIAPKIFTTFNLNGGRAVSGNQFKSVLHKLDNLQAAHSYCNGLKRNSPEVDRWRHPDMPPLGIATTPAGSRLMVPAADEGGFLDDGLTPTKKALQRWALKIVSLLLAAGFLLWGLSPSGREVSAALTDWVLQQVFGE